MHLLCQSMVAFILHSLPMAPCGDEEVYSPLLWLHWKNALYIYWHGSRESSRWQLVVFFIVMLEITQNFMLEHMHVLYEYVILYLWMTCIKIYSEPLQGDTRKIVKHFSFLAWPDMGIPETSETMLKFAKDVRGHAPLPVSDRGPIVIHCR